MKKQHASGALVPEGYEMFLGELKQRMQQAQIRAVLAVNHELVLLYWQIGRDIWARQGQAGWGAKIIDQLSKDLHQDFPDMAGFSPRIPHPSGTVIKRRPQQLAPA